MCVKSSSYGALSLFWLFFLHFGITITYIVIDDDDKQQQKNKCTNICENNQKTVQHQSSILRLEEKITIT
jgi:hypothetical protein